MNDEKKKGLYLLSIVASSLIIIFSITTLIKMSSHKVDYDSMNKEIMEYVSKLDNIKDIKSNGDGIYKIMLESDSWYAGMERDKMVFCKNVNETLTVICQKYKAIRDTQAVDVYYYDEDGIKVAEPGKGVTLESKILH
ncbi:hypothetical protein DS742_11740 [Lacrimispora amygdalina]|uniref:Uncharacterized protein n=1 Tax=Lacrimispora amygdalina TaxID=253257 RepID=A0A3E2NCN3_9FIRM|nr:hypothetical protein [Clostridium indicum]RFZ78777.1 hypothetical protein DS742_11740 [Clostridium indicum]